MKRSDYNMAANIAKQHYLSVLDELTEKILATEGNDDRVFGRGIDDIIESYSRKLWSISDCLNRLRRSGSRPQPAQIATRECAHNRVTEVLSDWFRENSGASVVSISFLDQLDKLVCIIVYKPGC